MQVGTRTAALSTPAPLTPSQQQLDERLRDWRKAEAEKVGLPQFFILGASSLRSIVLAHPRTLSQLQSIPGVGADTVAKFGPSILEICRP